MIILDFGSGNTCKNCKEYIMSMYRELNRIDTRKHKVIVKWQLFKEAGRNVPLDYANFDFAFDEGNKYGYEVTASVFDLESLNFLLGYNVPFIKIANNRDLDYLITYVSEEIPLYISGKPEIDLIRDYEHFFCVSDYPAAIEDYKKLKLKEGCNISDHTTNFDLYNEYKPKIVEWHYKLHFSTGLDSGPFARTPDQLKEVL